MDMRTLGFQSSRWQSRLRMLMLLLLIGVTGLSTSVVLAQADEQPATAADSVTGEAAADRAVATSPAAERFGVREMFTQADVVVKAVMIFLVLCSLLTWAVLFEKLVVFAKARRANQRFLAGFRNNDLTLLHEQAEHSAMGRMWQVAQAEVTHFGRNRSADADQINRLLQRMSLTASIVQERDLARLGSMMGVLATIGATAPFIGLFGTVWGILNSFASIATMKSASLAIVAPGIAEALLATALGLFAAIPAVMIFNKFARDINGFVGGLDNFSAEMIADVSRKLDEVK
ncbi:MotA/TolQ/ExbB proton channel family protein [Halopseudomonas pelagia]|uniref:Tol-Pal system subunit TolQ n=1 Tax=Halopseudomonas pelagia TaxID=553151 RepID=A0AA91U0I8_9GAMM|nr:MotA/TolQ/ExbB proton channel family protein [Halopseudomonas pelagia]PCC98248.1 Tol-Pal system subunit TolQ [Halopseudomonas pelagia]QFY57115.1 hypothetical protein EAO82_12515 [Halopseudomonas pelagia]